MITYYFVDVQGKVIIERQFWIIYNTKTIIAVCAHALRLYEENNDINRVEDDLIDPDIRECMNWMTAKKRRVAGSRMENTDIIGE